MLKQTLGPTWLSTPTEKINAMTTASFGMPQLVAKACEARVFAWAPSGRKHGNASEGRSEGRAAGLCSSHWQRRRVDAFFGRGAHPSSKFKGDKGTFFVDKVKKIECASRTFAGAK